MKRWSKLKTKFPTLITIRHLEHWEHLPFHPFWNSSFDVSFSLARSLKLSFLDEVTTNLHEYHYSTKVSENKTTDYLNKQKNSRVIWPYSGWDGREEGGKKRQLLTSFFPVFSTNVDFGPENFSPKTFIFNHFAILL